MDFKRATDKDYTTFEDHLIHHYGIALQEARTMLLLEQVDALTPLGHKHKEKLRQYLEDNLNRYLKLTWMVKD